MNVIKSLKRIFSGKEVYDDTEFDYNREIKLTDEDGELFRYKGQHDSNKPNGFGEAVYEGGDVYIGYFKNSKRDGVGMYKWISGDYFVGDWSNNERKGFGVNYIKSHDTVVFGKFDGINLIKEEGSFTKRLNKEHCVICGKHKKHVKYLIAGGIGNRAICDSCAFTAINTLKTELNYSEQEILGLINKPSGNIT